MDNMNTPQEENTTSAQASAVSVAVEERGAQEGAQTGSMSDMESYEKSFLKIEPGQYLTGKVVKIDKDEILVDVGYKTEGVIPPHEISQMGDDPGLTVGQEIEVMVLKVRDAEGELILSKKRADLEAAWKKIIQAFEHQEVIAATCIEQVKGGLIVDIGLRGFVPQSHVDVRPVRDLSDFVGEELRLKIMELDRSRRKVVLSRKKVIEEERESSRESTLKSLYEGEIREGKVARITNFGAFVNLGGVDGLIHISELSWRRVNHPSEVVRVGDVVEVLVLKVDSKKEKISLSLRQAKSDPWLTVGEIFKIGSLAKGKVSKLAKNYVFVELMEGVEGLIPLIELSEDKIIRPDDILKENQTIEVKILDVRISERRIILSLKQAQADSSREEYMGYMAPRGKNTIGDLLKSKMEAKELQDILSPKPPKAEQKPPVAEHKAPAIETPKPAAVEQKPPVAAELPKPPVAAEPPKPAAVEQKPPVAVELPKPPAAVEPPKPIVIEQKPPVAAELPKPPVSVEPPKPLVIEQKLPVAVELPKPPAAVEPPKPIVIEQKPPVAAEPSSPPVALEPPQTEESKQKVLSALDDPELEKLVEDLDDVLPDDGTPG